MKTKINVKFPAFVPVHKFLSLRLLNAMQTVCWLAVDPDSPLSKQIQGMFPAEEREDWIDAVTQIGIIFQQEMEKKSKSGETEAKGA